MKINLNPIYDLIRADGSIVINKNLVFAIGMNETIIYSELLSKHNYFSDRDKLTNDRYFYNTVDNLWLDTGLGEKPQKTAINKLKKLGLIEYKVKGLPAKRYFKIIENTQILLDFITKGRDKRQLLDEKKL